MAFELQSGFLHRKELPAIGDPERSGALVDLNWWIAFTHSSARLEEIQHSDDRPTALFRRADGSKFEVRYQFGKIIPQDLVWTDPAPMHELAAHMNEETKKPIQAAETTRGK